MVLIIGIAGAAALAVLLYNHLREQQPEKTGPASRDGIRPDPSTGPACAAS